MSKLGLHVHSWNHALLQYCKNVGGAVDIILDHNEMMVNEVKRAQPKSLLIARLWVPEQKLDDPIKNAREFTDLLLLHIDGCNYDGATGYNEWDGDLDYCEGRPAGLEIFKRYADFEAERSRILHREGLLSVVGGCSVGTPPEHWFSGFLPALEEGDFLHLHEYSAPHMWDAEHWHCLKYRHVYDYLKEHGLPILPLIISECGVDGGVAGRPKQGWRKFQFRPHQYMGQWDWYDGKMMEDDYVVGSCAFDCGGGGGLGWASFNMDPEMLPLYAKRIRAGGVDYWEPKEEKKMDIPEWLTDVRETLRRHPTERYPRRSLDKIDTIVVHHTATFQSTPEQIADYHVIHKGWAGAGYHVYVRKNGKAYLMNDLEAISIHAYGHHTHTVGLSFEGDFTRESAGEHQIERGKETVAWLRTILGEVPVLAHKAMPGSSTACPGRFPVGALIGQEPEEEDEVAELLAKMAELEALRKVDRAERDADRAAMLAARNTLNARLD